MRTLTFLEEVIGAINTGLVRLNPDSALYQGSATALYGILLEVPRLRFYLTTEAKAVVERLDAEWKELQERVAGTPKQSGG